MRLICALLLALACCQSPAQAICRQGRCGMVRPSVFAPNARPGFMGHHAWRVSSRRQFGAFPRPFARLRFFPG